MRDWLRRLERRHVGIVEPILAAATLGCASYGGHLSARPIHADDREVTLNADALIVDRGVGPQVLPNPELGLRFGIARHLDVGGRINAGSVEANGRWRMLATSTVDVAVVPGLGFGFVPFTNRDTGLFNASALATLLAGLNVDERTQLIVGMRGIATYAFPATAFRGDASEAKMLYFPGGSLGVRFPVGETLYLLPDVNVLTPYDSSTSEWVSPTIQGGLSLQLD